MSKPKPPGQSPNELRRRAEAVLDASLKAPVEGKAVAAAEAQRLVHELSVHQIELEMQNDELDRARGEAESALALYADLYEHAPVGYLTLDRDGVVRLANLTATRLLALERSRLIGSRLGLLLATASRQRLGGFLARVLASTTREVCEVELTAEGSDGIFLELTGVATAGRDACRVTVADVTGRKLAERALLGSEERYRTLLANLDDVVFTTDTAGRVTFVSQAVARYGLTPEEVVGQPLAPLVDDADRANLLKSYAERVAGATPEPFEFRRSDPSGRVHHLRARSRPLVVAGQVAGLTGILTDVTRQRETEEQLRVAQKMEAVARLAGGVAHDFNNLLGVISISAELAKEELPAGTVAAADLDEIQKAVQRAQALTRQLLAFGRRQVLKPEVLDLNAVVAGVERMLGRVLGEDVKLTFAPAAKLCATRADPGQLEQVLLNLVVNARDAMPRGGSIRIETGCVHLDAPRATVDGELPPGEYATFSVSDTGTGIDEATRARIFEPFFTTKPTGKGTGLGLAMVYGIVKQSGGAVEVESTPGAGSTFRVYLPASKAEAEARGSSRPLGETRGSGTLLMVEDEAALRQLTSRVLSAAGYDVLSAASADEAIALCEAHRGSLKLLVTDVVMPGMDGIALAAHLTKLIPGLRVLFMSGYSDEVIAAHGALAAGVELVEKPFMPQTLLAAVARALSDGES